MSTAVAVAAWNGHGSALLAVEGGAVERRLVVNVLRVHVHVLLLEKERDDFKVAVFGGKVKGGAVVVVGLQV